MNPAIPLLILLLGSAAINSQAQTTTSTPKGFEIRKNGSGTGNGSSVGLIPSGKKQKPQVITYTALSKVREWKNSDGKTIKARLLAFPSLIEDQKTKGETPHFTVIRDQKVRFLISPNNKATLYPLEKLSDLDQEFIEEIARAAARAAESSQQGKEKASVKKN